MSTITVINPAAGQGEAVKLASKDGIYHVTSSVGDAEVYTEQTLKDNDGAKIVVYGGDGTLNEVINGVVKSGAKNVTVAVVPTGTGNDFIRSGEHGDTIKCDVVKYNDRYFINILNIGFDSDVVAKTSELKKKPFIKGSLAYVLGVVSCLFKKFGQKITVEIENEDGSIEKIEDEFLLFLASNGKYYGGGFKASPESDLDDGLIDVLIVKKISRLKFIMIISEYKKGNHIKAGQVVPKFSDIITYRRCRKVKVSGMDKICVDGEIEACSSADISVVPKCINFAF